MPLPLLLLLPLLRPTEDPLPLLRLLPELELPLPTEEPLVLDPELLPTELPRPEERSVVRTRVPVLIPLDLVTPDPLDLESTPLPDRVL